MQQRFSGNNAYIEWLTESGFDFDSDEIGSSFSLKGETNRNQSPFLPKTRFSVVSSYRLKLEEGCPAHILLQRLSSRIGMDDKKHFVGSKLLKEGFALDDLFYLRRLACKGKLATLVRIKEGYVPYGSSELEEGFDLNLNDEHLGDLRARMRSGYLGAEKIISDFLGMIDETYQVYLLSASSRFDTRERRNVFFDRDNYRKDFFVPLVQGVVRMLEGNDLEVKTNVEL